MKKSYVITIVIWAVLMMAVLMTKGMLKQGIIWDTCALSDTGEVFISTEKGIFGYRDNQQYLHIPRGLLRSFGVIVDDNNDLLVVSGSSNYRYDTDARKLVKTDSTYRLSDIDRVVSKNLSRGGAVIRLRNIFGYSFVTGTAANGDAIRIRMPTICYIIKILLILGYIGMFLGIVFAIIIKSALKD